MKANEIKTYAGIGSRETPPNVLRLMGRIAVRLEELGWTLRSGGANGADAAFGEAVERKEIYVPWNGFNGVSGGIVPEFSIVEPMAAAIHPAWHMCNQGARKLHARNICQILGLNADSPCKMVICWTPGGNIQGGTATAIRLAMSHNIPVFNLYKGQAELAAFMNQ